MICSTVIGIRSKVKSKHSSFRRMPNKKQTKNNDLIAKQINRMLRQNKIT
jgi:hypothetical protein